MFQLSTVGERPLMTSDIRVGREYNIAPKIGRYRVGQGIGRYTDNGHPERAFFQKFETFGLGQTNWAGIL